MTRIPFPSHPPRQPQTEVCCLCMREVGAWEGAYCEVIGPLHGHFICRYHGDLATNPSWIDLRGAETTLLDAITEAVREEPYGCEVWWEDPDITLGYIEREDDNADGTSNLLRRESGMTDYFEREG